MDARVQFYLKRARDFFEGVVLMKGEPRYRHSAALLAIHSAISYSDALRVGMGDEALLADDHTRAVAALDGLLATRRGIDRIGVRHLSYLIDKKNLVAYGRGRLSEGEALSLILHAERFALWADSLGTQLRVEGWFNDGKESANPGTR